MFKLLSALPQNGAEVNGRLTDFIVFVAENINARINEAVSFCKFPTLLGYLLKCVFRQSVFNCTYLLPSLL